MRRKNPIRLAGVSSSGLGTAQETRLRRDTMISKLVRGAVLTGVLVAFSAPIVANAADAPMTKADCKKAKDMKWDKTTKTCVKK
ncbi:MAG: hypothetical protein J0H04_12130 [Hyphomicrobium denitrificans]|jgi:ABC-type Fe2+-enterobactin transport system substrate-binding protein|nr:hypothetical protein [Hyphomicrobium denitrificans]